MPKRLNDQVVAKPAVAVSAGSTAAALAVVATKVNGTGFSRARFIFNMGNAGSTASLSAGLGVWQAATSGATYALITGASGAAVTSGVLSGGLGNIVVIDVPIDGANPWLQMSGSFVSATPAHGAIVELYDSINRPPTTAENQVVVV
jgi:hypothetical protein